MSISPQVNGVITLANKLVESCGVVEQLGMKQMLERIARQLDELLNSLRGFCGEVDVACKVLEEARSTLSEAAHMSNELLRGVAGLLLDFTDLSKERLVSILSGLQGLAGLIYQHLAHTASLVQAVSSLLSTYSKMMHDADPRLGLIADETRAVLRAMRELICGYLVSVVNGLVELHEYYAARGRMWAYNLFELVFGYLAVLLAGLVRGLEDFSKLA